MCVGGGMWKAELEKGASVFARFHHLWKPTDRKIEAGGKREKS